MEKGNLEKVDMEMGSVEINVTNHINGNSWKMCLRGKIEDFRNFYLDSFFNVYFLHLKKNKKNDPLISGCVVNIKLSYTTS